MGQYTDNIEEIEDYIDYLDQSGRYATEEDEYIDEKQAPPQITSSAGIKYQVEAQIPKRIRKIFEEITVFWGRHVAMGNSPRKENPRHLNQIEMVFNYNQDDMILFADRGLAIASMFTAETTMERGNEKHGGFEREMQQSLFRHGNYDISQEQKIPMTAEKKRFLSSFRKNKKGE